MVRKASAVWKGDLPSGKGELKSESGAVKGKYSFTSRFEDGKGTNPEELIAAAHSGCYSMALSHMLSEAGFVPDSVETSAHVTLEKQGDGFAVTKIHLVTEGKVPGLDEKEFLKKAEEAKSGCPISVLLQSVPITLEAKLKS